MMTIVQELHIWTTSFSIEPYKDLELSYRMVAYTTGHGQDQLHNTRIGICKLEDFGRCLGNWSAVWWRSHSGWPCKFHLLLLVETEQVQSEQLVFGSTPWTSHVFWCIGVLFGHPRIRQLLLNCAEACFRTFPGIIYATHILKSSNWRQFWSRTTA